MSVESSRWSLSRLWKDKHFCRGRNTLCWSSFLQSTYSLCAYSVIFVHLWCRFIQWKEQSASNQICITSNALLCPLQEEIHCKTHQAVNKRLLARHLLLYFVSWCSFPPFIPRRMAKQTVYETQRALSAKQSSKSITFSSHVDPEQHQIMQILWLYIRIMCAQFHESNCSPL